MREILFRGKRADNGEWVEGFYFKELGSFIKEKASNISTQTYLVIPKTVGQFTGLTDKSGKKIFEGDIIELPVFVDGVPKNGVVFWCERYANFGIQTRHQKTDFYYHFGKETTVIGNIHDNPELLKGGS